MGSDERAAGVSTAVVWTGRVISALPVLMLLFSASMKLAKPPEVVKGMEHFGYPEHLLVPLAVVEIGCAVIYAIPQTAVLGAILMTGYLGGATATHVRVGEAWWMPVLLGALAWLGLLMRDVRLRPLLPLRT